MNTDFTLRLARSSDIPAITVVMKAAIRENMKPYLSAAEIEAAAETMGVDETLIDDETYFVAECGSEIAACGGWGKRKTLYGGGHAPTRDDRFQNPETDAARIRAMYTHPNFIRRGIAKQLLTHCERAAFDGGFKTIELGSTIAGHGFYKALGYTEFSRETVTASNGLEKVTILMRKALPSS